MKTPTNEALWLLDVRGGFEVRTSTHPTPGPGQVVVRVRAVAVNPVDAITGPFRRLVTPWMRYPTVIGSDVAGEIAAVGEGMTRFEVGDRVVGFAAGQERLRNNSEEGGFQHYVTVLERVCAELPDSVTFEQAAVLPLGVSTAAAGLYEKDQLALPLPTWSPSPRGEVVLVWGASTSVGSNAVQLARASGYTVIATAGRQNHDFVRSLGAQAVFDYRDHEVDQQIVEAIGHRHLAGSIAIGAGALTHALRIAGRTSGTRRIASAYPDPLTRVRSFLARARGIRVTSIWGGTPVQSPVGPAIFRDFLPVALSTGQFRPAPDPRVFGIGLDQVPGALAALRAGVSATKLVVTVTPEEIHP
ncbi:zinc-binding alcohol dehydrogenase family protein [Cryobacterium zhongshanensis]|uniref:Zinc-binding alcohol dehydrogenase family protein n=1 Tax=Cryobacterium zhongshanensis TaxID=2928153 RepID=A0AA41QXU6_9MICO|nr:zinc-binding alcohol dehydrogenase family protein [Cryobacterium zhongshanensis]MCI4658893.1 zinc-binding alcohol dehydrogenase family protein [Cryobacterium zhongshanensis]